MPSGGRPCDKTSIAKIPNPNKREVKKERKEEEKPYCLTAEEGFLFVFVRDRNNICLDTHMPLSEFPIEEQEKLMGGIWFSTMAEILSYLESYTS